MITKELKREVASQILEYGANILLSMDTRNLRKMVEENNDISIREFLNNEIKEEDFWEKVYNNLNAEKFVYLLLLMKFQTDCRISSNLLTEIWIQLKYYQSK